MAAVSVERVGRLMTGADRYRLRWLTRRMSITKDETDEVLALRGQVRLKKLGID